MTQKEYLASLKESRADVKRQLGYFEKGMRVSINGSDRTAKHVAALKKALATYDKLLGDADA